MTDGYISSCFRRATACRAAQEANFKTSELPDTSTYICLETRSISGHFCRNRSNFSPVISKSESIAAAFGEKKSQHSLTFWTAWEHAAAVKEKSSWQKAVLGLAVQALRISVRPSRRRPSPDASSDPREDSRPDRPEAPCPPERQGYLVPSPPDGDAD